MKILTYQPSPNYRTTQSTTSIMNDLTLCLLAVVVFATAWYSTTMGAAYGLRVVGLTATAVVTALVCDALWATCTKQDIKTFILSNYSWVTALILVLISQLRVSYYAVAVCTAIAVIFGKHVFGGFGQNIFNPAAFGQAVLMSNFAATYSEDFATGATPTTVAKGFGWLLRSADYSRLPGIGDMILGNYASTIGSTCAILLLLCFIYLLIRKDIDWQMPVVYVATIFIEILVIALIAGVSAQLAIFNILAGGVLFGAVFMITDPVTSPVTIPGRMLFAAGAATLTVILRLKSNLPDGVLYSILLMNALVPAIDKIFDGNQIKDSRKFSRRLWIPILCLLSVAFGIGALSANEKKVEEEEAAAKAETAASSEASASSAPAMTLGTADFSKAQATAVANGDGSYAVEAKGFAGTLTATITVQDGKIESFTELSGKDDGDGVGDSFFEEGGLDAFKGATLDSSVDEVSGATLTSRAVNGMAQAALKAAADASPDASASSAPAMTLGTADFSKAQATAVANGDGSYAVEAKGFAGTLTATITIQGGKIESFTELSGKDDGDGVGDSFFEEGGLDAFKGATLDSLVDEVSGATFTSQAVNGMAQAALKAALEN